MITAIYCIDNISAQEDILGADDRFRQWEKKTEQFGTQFDRQPTGKQFNHIVSLSTHLNIATY